MWPFRPPLDVELLGEYRAALAKLSDESEEQLRRLESRLEQVEEKLAADRLQTLSLVEKLTRNLNQRIAKREERAAAEEAPGEQPRSPGMGMSNWYRHGRR